MNIAGEPRDLGGAAPGHEPTPPRDRPERTGGGSIRPVVLLVDDVAGNLLALEGMLSRDDIEIATATSGQAALEILLEREVALAIVDIQMPGMDGFELASLMRGVEKTRYVPIIFVTAGSGDKARVFKGYEAGAVDYLVKPVDEQVLRGKVDVFVTLERHRQRLREADRMREMFIAVLGHDLRNPLGSILLAAELMQQHSGGSDENDLVVQRILRNAERMKRMIEQLLDATRFRRDGRVTLVSEPADLRELVAQIAGELEGAAARVRLEVLGDSRGTWDVDRVLQILANLLGNAVQHSPPGSSVVVRIDGCAADTVAFHIQNGGPAIPAKLHPVLFEPFRRHDVRRQGREGLGLGLHIARQLTLAHGGTISFTSTEDDGTSFTVTLPRHFASLLREPSANHESGGKTVAAMVPDGASTILLVEDEPSARDALAELLEGHGCRVLATENATAAIELAARHDGSVDLLLTDVELPGMRGDVLAEKLRGAHPGLRVIFMSGHSDPPRDDAAFLEKPIDLERLVETIEQTLSNRGRR